MNLSGEHADSVFYGIAAEEIQSGKFEKGLMAKALTKKRGDKKEADLLYIEWRVGLLKRSTNEDHSDSLYYSAAANEVQSGRIDKGLMAKALTKTRGEKNEAQLLYIEWRVTVLQTEAVARAAEIRRLSQEEDPVFQAEQRRKERAKENSDFMKILIPSVIIFILPVIILIIYLIFSGRSN